MGISAQGVAPCGDRENGILWGIIDKILLFERGYGKKTLVSSVPIAYSVKHNS